MSLLAILAAAGFAVGGVPLKPGDILDGRAIAGGDGKPVVMITLTAAAAKRIAGRAQVTLDGKPVAARVTDAVIEIDGTPGFPAAEALALRLSGKPPLPETEGE
jgi:hypothetical protein